LTLIPAHHSFARKAIHALNRAIAVIGKILLSDTLPFGCVIGRLSYSVGACREPLDSEPNELGRPFCRCESKVKISFEGFVATNYKWLMNRKLPLKHKSELQELNLTYRVSTERLTKEAKIEGYVSFAGAIGAFVTMLSFFDPHGTHESIGSLGLTIAFIAIPFGAWSYFAPPSNSKSRAEFFALQNVRKRLQEMGYDPYFADRQVAFNESNRLLDVYNSENYESEARIDSSKQHKKNVPLLIQDDTLLYKVFVDDNFNYLDRSERYLFGEYESKEEAIITCKSIVDRFLNHNLEPNLSSLDLYQKWQSFGQDPWIKGGGFDATVYAYSKSKKIIDGLKQLG
jgi:hypothetical protein